METGIKKAKVEYANDVDSETYWSGFQVFFSWISFGSSFLSLYRLHGYYELGSYHITASIVYTKSNHCIFTTIYIMIATCESRWMDWDRGRGLLRYVLRCLLRAVRVEPQEYAMRKGKYCFVSFI